MTVHEAIPATTGVRFLRERGIAFVPHFYPFQEHCGTAHAVASLNVDEHSIVRTILDILPAFHNFDRPSVIITLTIIKRAHSADLRKKSKKEKEK